MTVATQALRQLPIFSSQPRTIGQLVREIEKVCGALKPSPTPVRRKPVRKPKK